MVLIRAKIPPVDPVAKISGADLTTFLLFCASGGSNADCTSFTGGFRTGGVGGKCIGGVAGNGGIVLGSGSMTGGAASFVISAFATDFKKASHKPFSKMIVGQFFPDQ